MFTWWNAIYSLPLAFVLIFLAVTSLVSLAGGLFDQAGHGDSDVDADADLDVGGDIHAHADAHGHTHVDAYGHTHAPGNADGDPDVDLDFDADVDAAGSAEIRGGHDHATGHHAHGHGHGHGDSPLMGVLALIGVGQAPLLMLLQILLLLWGLIGVGLHQAFGAAGPGALLWSLPMTLTLSVLGTRSFASVFGRYFKPMQTSVVQRDQIVGRTGRVVFPVTEEEGTVHVRDQHGTLHRLRARSAHGQLSSGQEIIVLGYDPMKQIYHVDDASSFVDR